MNAVFDSTGACSGHAVRLVISERMIVPPAKVSGPSSPVQ